jgi:hypothetical protein
MDLSADPPREWVFHARQWLPLEGLTLHPDGTEWEEWDMGVNSMGAPCSLFINNNTRETLWSAPPAPVLSSTPAAVPLRIGKTVQLREGTRELRDTWHLPAPDISQASRMRYLDDVPTTCRSHAPLSTFSRIQCPIYLNSQA